jgi:hypothetical protein
LVAVSALAGNAEDYSKVPKPYVTGHVGGAKRDPGNKRLYPEPMAGIHTTPAS